jgi:molybdopterin converting factor small subunit
MSEIINKDGVDIEVFTADEIEAQKQEAIEQYKLENPDKEGELAELQEKLKETEEKLAKADDKATNIGALRKAREDAEKKLTDFDAKLEEKINAVKREVIEGVNKDFFVDNIKALAGGDEELQKKIELEYNTTLKGVIPSSKAEISEKLNKAYILAGGTKDFDAMTSSVISSGGVGRLNIKSNNQKLTPEEQAMGANFGLSADDLKKYNK